MSSTTALALCWCHMACGESLSQKVLPGYTFSPDVTTSSVYAKPVSKEATQFHAGVISIRKPCNGSE